MAGEKCKQLQILMHINEVSEKTWHLACESAARTCGVLSEKEPGEAKRVSFRMIGIKMACSGDVRRAMAGPRRITGYSLSSSTPSSLPYVPSRL